ncbi:hypothetical protein [Cupriavidus sp. UYPR2.512]|nr:hypothetical protein [Cupriavidus sp. UYPR2.512]
MNKYEAKQEARRARLAARAAHARSAATMQYTPALKRWLRSFRSVSRS